MTALRKKIPLIMVGALAVVALFCAAHAAYPGRFAPGTPYSLRLPTVIYAVPGVPEFVEWRARAHAKRDAAAGRWSLFGYGENGTDFGLELQCEILEYERGQVRAAVLPSWASYGVKGTAQLSCDAVQGGVGGEFAVAEMSCLVGGADYFYSIAYNREVVRLRSASMKGQSGPVSGSSPADVQLQVMDATVECRKKFPTYLENFGYNPFGQDGYENPHPVELDVPNSLLSQILNKTREWAADEGFHNCYSTMCACILRVPGREFAVYISVCEGNFRGFGAEAILYLEASHLEVVHSVKWHASCAATTQPQLEQQTTPEG